MIGIQEERTPSNGRRPYKEDTMALPRPEATENGIQTLSTSVGTPATTIPDVGASFSQSTLNNIVASLALQINNAGVQASRQLQDANVWRLSGAGTPTLVRGPFGEWLMSTGSTLNNQAIIDPRRDSSFPRRLDNGFNTSRSFRFAVRFQTPADIANLLIQFGMASGVAPSLNLTTDADFAAYRASSAEQEQTVRATSRVGSAAAVDRVTPFTLAAANVYTAICEVGPNRVPKFRLRDDTAGGDSPVVANEQSVGNFPAMSAGVAVFPYFGIQTLAGVSQSVKILDIDAGLTVV